MSEENTKAVAKAAKAGNVVVMKDGRSVDFGVRGKLKTEVTLLEDGVKLAIDVVNGDSHSITISKDHVLALTLLGYGLKQKITDTVVKAEEADDVSLGVQQIIGQLEAGTWSQRSSGEGVARGFSELLEAIRRLKGYEVDSAEHTNLKTSLLAKTEEELKALKTNGHIKATIAAIQAEKANERAAKLAGASGEEKSVDDLLV
jgi:hypothetical protein